MPKGGRKTVPSHACLFKEWEGVAGFFRFEGAFFPAPVASVRLSIFLYRPPYSFRVLCIRSYFMFAFCVRSGTSGRSGCTDGFYPIGAVFLGRE